LVTAKQIYIYSKKGLDVNVYKALNLSFTSILLTQIPISIHTHVHCMLDTTHAMFFF